MSEQTEPGSAFAPASGYATVARFDPVEYLPMGGRANGMMEADELGDYVAFSDYAALEAEVIRLRASASLRDEIIEECAKAVETQVRGTSYQWLGESMFARLGAESAQRVRSLKSHNDIAETRPETTGQPN